MLMPASYIIGSCHQASMAKTNPRTKKENSTATTKLPLRISFTRLLSLRLWWHIYDYQSFRDRHALPAAIRNTWDAFFVLSSM
jgi:hypothetical protein